jgi:hypothetical protein
MPYIKIVSLPHRCVTPDIFIEINVNKNAEGTVWECEVCQLQWELQVKCQIYKWHLLHFTKYIKSQEKLKG